MKPDLKVKNTINAFHMNGSIYTLTTLELHASDLTAIKKQLHHIIEKAPHFFKQSPVVIALEKLPHNTPDIHLTSLRRLLEENNMVLVAIRGGNAEIQKNAALAGIAWLPANQQKDHEETTSCHTDDKIVMFNKTEDGKHQAITDTCSINQPPVEKIIPTQIIEKPVRSGQQIHSEGDLIILGPVGAGAELLAEGNIHVYGPLRGRALAGINGNKDARIFCQHFEAELISINGQYQLPEDNNNPLWGRSVMICLNDQGLHLQALS